MNIISIIIPAYNRRELVLDAVRSCLAQDWRELEVIVVDDGSTDGNNMEIEILAKEDPRVILTRQENAGQCAARNAGFRLARGNLVKFLDSDDALAPGAIAAQAAILQETGAEFVAGEGLGYDEGKLGPLRECWKSELAVRSDSVRCIPLRSFIMNHEGTMNEVLMRRELIEAASESEKLRAAEEINFLWRLYFKRPDLEVVRHSRCVYFKRLSLSSLAAQMRQQKEVPWALVSTLETVQLVIDQNKQLDAELKRQLFDNLYRCIVLACRNRQDRFVEPALAAWRRGQLPPPALQPWHHNFLHRLLGLKGAEQFLSVARSVAGKRTE